MSYRHSRRQFIQNSFYTVITFLGATLASCRSKEKAPESGQNAALPVSCDDLSGLSEEDIKLRETFGYVNESPVADNQCSNCNLWLPQATNQECGKCLLFKGPVYVTGFCTSWAPQL